MPPSARKHQALQVQTKQVQSLVFGRGDKSDVYISSSHNAGGRGKSHRPRRCLGQAESRERLVRAGWGKLGVPDQALLLREVHTGGEWALGT